MDDAGATAAITRRVMRAWREGLIDSLSILANGDALEEVGEALESHADRPVRLVVHLNLSEGPSLVPPREIPLLVHGDGHLRHTFGSLAALWLRSTPRRRRELLSQVDAEWHAQIHAVEKLVSPRKIQAVDGHIHVHTLPFLGPTAARLARTHGIAGIRIPCEPPHWAGWAEPAPGINVVKHLLLRALSSRTRRIASDHGLDSPEAFVGLLYSGRMTRESARAGVEAARRRGARQTEVLFHIGRASQDEAGRWVGNPSVGAFSLDERRDREYDELLRFRRGDG